MEQAEPLKATTEEPDDGTIYASMDKKKIPEFEGERGRQHLLCKEYDKAAKSFSKAIMAFEFLIKDNKITPEQIRVMLKDVIIPCYSNITLCYYKQGMFESVVKFADSVIQNDKDNVKAHYRRGVAYKQLKRYREAKDDLNKVKALDESMTGEVNRLLGEIKNLEILEKAKRKKVAETMLSGYVEESLEDRYSDAHKNQKEGCWRKATNCFKAAFQKIKAAIFRT